MFLFPLFIFENKDNKISESNCTLALFGVSNRFFSLKLAVEVKGCIVREAESC